eukprot:4186517-Amphidinium_carterae.1
MKEPCTTNKAQQYIQAWVGMMFQCTANIQQIGQHHQSFGAEIAITSGVSLDGGLPLSNCCIEVVP